MRILVIDRSPPTDARQGNALIGRELFRRLREHELTLVAPAPDGSLDDARAALIETFDAVHLVPRRRPVGALLGWLEPGRMQRLPVGPRMDLDATRRMFGQLRTLIADGRFDVVHVRQLPMAAYGSLFGGPRLLELIDSETLGSERARPRTARTRLRARVAARVERRAMATYDAVTVVAEADAERLRRLDPARRVVVVPNGVDAVYFAPRPEVRPDPDLVTFVGAMSFPPNVAAMRYFCDSVLPLVRRARPGARVAIVGRDPGAEVMALTARPGVEVTGAVPDVRPYLARAAVVVAPMISGSGIKNKVLEAMAAGRPVVATSLAVEGLPVASGRELIIAERPEEMATAIAEVLAEPAQAQALGTAARGLVERSHTWEAAAAAYDSLYRELAATSARP